MSTTQFPTSAAGDGAAAPAGVRLGHIHLRVADLPRAVAFYRDVLRFAPTMYRPDFDLPAAVFPTRGRHYPVALSAFDADGGSSPSHGYRGLYHLALRYPGRAAIAAALLRLERCGHSPDLAADCGGSVSLYLRDPDGNGIELYYERPRERWYDDRGRLVVRHERIDPRSLLTGDD